MEMSLLIKSNRMKEDHMESINDLGVKEVEFCNLLERPPTYYALYANLEISAYLKGLKC